MISNLQICHICKQIRTEIRDEVTKYNVCNKLIIPFVYCSKAILFILRNIVEVKTCTNNLARVMYGLFVDGRI